jgi:hypothetical protein
VIGRTNLKTDNTRHDAVLSCKADIAVPWSVLFGLKRARV